MYLCVDMRTRRVAPWPEPVVPILREGARSHSGLARPDWVGRRVAMPSPA